MAQRLDSQGRPGRGKARHGVHPRRSLRDGHLSHEHIRLRRPGQKLSRYGLATAAGIFKNAVNILLLVLANTIAKKSGEERLI